MERRPVLAFRCRDGCDRKTSGDQGNGSDYAPTKCKDDMAWSHRRISPSSAPFQQARKNRGPKQRQRSPDL